MGRGAAVATRQTKNKANTLKAVKITKYITALLGVVLSLNLSPASAGTPRPAAAAGPAITAPRSFFVVQSYTSVQPNKPRYQRGETIRVQAEAWIMRYDPVGPGWRVTRVKPAADTVVWISEKSSRGTRILASGRTDRQGRFAINYRVPTDPRMDNLRVCAWTLNEEPFEGTEVRIPLGR